MMGCETPGGMLVEVRIELAVDLDQRIFLRCADEKAHNHQALAGARGRIDIFDAGDLVHQHFDGQRDALLDFGRRRARHGGVISSMGTRICGSSSRGMTATAKMPIASEATMMSGVSLELRKRARGGRRCRVPAVWLVLHG